MRARHYLAPLPSFGRPKKIPNLVVRIEIRAASGKILLSANVSRLRRFCSKVVTRSSCPSPYREAQISLGGWRGRSTCLRADAPKLQGLPHLCDSQARNRRRKAQHEVLNQGKAAATAQPTSAAPPVARNASRSPGLKAGTHSGPAGNRVAPRTPGLSGGTWGRQIRAFGRRSAMLIGTNPRAPG